MSAEGIGGGAAAGIGAGEGSPGIGTTGIGGAEGFGSASSFGGNESSQATATIDSTNFGNPEPAYPSPFTDLAPFSPDLSPVLDYGGVNKPRISPSEVFNM